MKKQLLMLTACSLLAGGYAGDTACRDNFPAYSLVSDGSPKSDAPVG